MRPWLQCESDVKCLFVLTSCNASRIIHASTLQFSFILIITSVLQPIAEWSPTCSRQDEQRRLQHCSDLVRYSLSRPRLRRASHFPQDQCSALSRSPSGYHGAEGNRRVQERPSNSYQCPLHRSARRATLSSRWWL